MKNIKQGITRLAHEDRKISSQQAVPPPTKAVKKNASSLYSSEDENCLATTPMDFALFAPFRL